MLFNTVEAILSDTVRWVSECTLEASSHDVQPQLFRCVSWALPYGLLYSNILKRWRISILLSYNSAIFLKWLAVGVHSREVV